MNVNTTTELKNSTNFQIYSNSSIRRLDFWDYSLFICLIFGTIGNSLSILVMSSKKLRNSNAALFVSDK